MRYRLIKGVRFQRGVPKAYIESFLGKEETSDKYRYMANDDLCFMEHKTVGSSSSSSLRPLTPYSILAGKRTAEEMAKGRNRQGTMWGQYVIDPANDYQEIYGGEDGGDVLLRIPKSIRQAFLETILAIEPILVDPKYPKFFCCFNKPAFDPKTARIILPTLMEVNNIKLARKFATKIRLKEILVSEHNGIKFVVDKKGWRVDLM